MIHRLSVACVLTLWPVCTLAGPLGTRELIDRCISGAEANGWPERTFVNSTDRRDESGAIIEQLVLLRGMVGGRGTGHQLICSYTVVSDKISFLGMVGADYALDGAPLDWSLNGDDPTSPQTSADACTRSIERRGYRFDGITEQSDKYKNGRVVARLVKITARRGGQDVVLNCTYTFASRLTRIE